MSHFSLVCFQGFLFVLSFLSSVCLSVISLGLCCWGRDSWSSRFVFGVIWEVFIHYFFNYFFFIILFLISLWDSYNTNVPFSNIPQDLMLYSFCFNNFSLCVSNCTVYIDLTSSSLTFFSIIFILLLSPSREYVC